MFDTTGSTGTDMRAAFDGALADVSGARLTQVGILYVTAATSRRTSGVVIGFLVPSTRVPATVSSMVASGSSGFASAFNTRKTAANSLASISSLSPSDVKANNVESDDTDTVLILSFGSMAWAFAMVVYCVAVYLLKGKCDKVFHAADSNGDGVVDRKEWTAMFGTDEEFDEYDANGDGLVTQKEYERRIVRGADIVVTSAHETEDDALHGPRHEMPKYMMPLEFHHGAAPETAVPEPRARRASMPAILPTQARRGRRMSIPMVPIIHHHHHHHHSPDSGELDARAQLDPHAG